MRPSMSDALTVSELADAGLLRLGNQCSVSRHAVFLPVDRTGTVRSIVLGDGSAVGAFAMVHGGTEVCCGARVEEHVVVGKPEFGYAVRRTYDGSGAWTEIGEDAVLRAGAILYAGVSVGPSTVVGHHTLLRSNVRLGAETQIGHQLTIERDVQIGFGVRCSPGSHLTSSTMVADGVFLGAGVRTINDNRLVWRNGPSPPPLSPPRFESACRVGSGVTVLGGVVIGERALIGAGSVVTRDIPPDAVAFGNPATLRGQRSSQL